MGVDHGAFRGLPDQREVVVRRMLRRKIPRAPLAGFLAHEAGKRDFRPQVRNPGPDLREGGQHGGHGALGIAGPAAVEAAPADFAAEGIDGHARDADGIGMRSEQDAGLPPALRRGVGGEPANDVGPPGQHLLIGDHGTEFGEEIPHKFRTGFFPGVRRTGIAIRVHAGDGDEIAAEEQSDERGRMLERTGYPGFFSSKKVIMALFPPEWGAEKRSRAAVRGKRRGRFLRRRASRSRVVRTTMAPTPPARIR